MMAPEPVHLHPEAVEAVAARVAELVLAHRPHDEQPAPHMTVADVARWLVVGPAWVYEHADELGAIRLGDGRRGRLRFDPARVSEGLASCSARRQSTSPRVPAAKRNRRPLPGTPLGTEAPLLPVRGATDPEQHNHKRKDKP